MSLRHIAPWFYFIAMAGSVPAQQTLVLREGLNNYGGTRDNSIYEDRPISTNGGHGFIYAGNTADRPRRSPRRALIEFDVSAIPAESVILEVELRLVVERSAGNRMTPEPHLLHRLTSDWGEGTVDTIQINPQNDGGGGSPAQAGDATWLSNFHDQSLWTVPGGDFAETPSGGGDLFGEQTEGFLTGAGMVADIAAWVAAPEENFGWVLIGNEIDAQRAKRIYSSENDEGAKRPTLTIVFEPPPNASSGWTLYE